MRGLPCEHVDTLKTVGTWESTMALRVAQMDRDCWLIAPAAVWPLSGLLRDEVKKRDVCTLSPLKVPAANPSPPPPQFAPEKWSSLLSTGGVILWSLNDIIAKIFPACSFPIASKIPPAFQACVLQAPPRHRGYVSLGHSCKRLPWRDSWHLRCWSLDPQPPPSSL